MALVQATLVSASAPAANALAVYGQPDLHSNTNNNGGLSSTSLYNPQGLAANTNGVFVTDTFNNRVLHFPLNINLANMVYGQPDFSQNSVNQGGPASASTLNYPVGVTIDSNGGLFVADEGNNRVLYFPDGSTTATKVYGQGAGCNNFSSTVAASGTTGLHGPWGVTVDNSGGIYVSDTGNNRVVYFPSSGCTASRVYGQGATGTSFNTSAPGSTATALNLPYATAVDSSGGLFVADNANNRVVYYPPSSFTATRVYGQVDFTGHTFGTSPTTLHDPSGLALDVTGGLYVTDFANNRVVYYQPGTTTASRVYGQPGYTSSTANYGGLGPASLQAPFGIAMISDGTLLVSDSYNNRVVSFSAIPEYTNSIAAAVYGQPDLSTGTTTFPQLPNNTSIAFPLQTVVDHSGGIYIADADYKRVLYFPAGSPYATKVYGNGPSGDNFTSYPTGVDASHFERPAGLALDRDGGLYVSDNLNNRVLYFPAGSFTATKVYGQPDFNINSPGLSQTGLHNPFGIALDAAGGLYVTDSGNNRVLYYPPTPAPATNIAATRVYGQGASGTNFTSGAYDVTPTSMYGPAAVVVDNANGVYISDSLNSRILYFPAGSVTPTRVYGQTGFFSRAQGTSANQLDHVYGLSLDAVGGLYAVDYFNNRVLYFPAGTTTATRVYGQPDFITKSDNYGGTTTASSLSGPGFVSLDANQNIYVSDNSNHRVLRYNYLPDCSPLTVTNPLDDGSNCTLRAALMQAHSGDTVTINFGAGATIHLQSSLGTLPPNLTIQGLCSSTGPAITLDGTGVKNIGVQLSGGDHLLGLKIKGFEGTQLKITTSKSTGSNILSCVSASRN
ncbi:MAG TPA: NHL repeat-containing protein [Chloroflexia bacterium]|nr:NHL repeat-containing protein [Chloroflexia bacterium]